MDVAAVILAGGTAARLGGADKAAVRLGGRSLLEHALAAVAPAGEVVVVGDPVPTGRPVTFVREHPPLGGPVAGLVAGRRALSGRPAWLLVQAVDMPRVTTATHARLLAAAAGHDGAVLCGAGGWRKLVLAVSVPALDAATPTVPRDCSVRRLLAPLDLADVPAAGEEGHGVDTWQDLLDLGGELPPARTPRRGCEGRPGPEMLGP